MDYKIGLHSRQNIFSPYRIKSFQSFIRVGKTCKKDCFEKSCNTTNSKPFFKVLNMPSIIDLGNLSLIDRFSLNELVRLLKLKNEEITFIKPFARQKNYMGIFNYSTNDLLEIAKENKQNQSRYMDLMTTKLPFTDIKKLVYDSNIDTTNFRATVRNLQLQYAHNIDNLSINQIDNKYQILLTTKNPHELHHFTYVKNKKNNLGIKKMTLSRFYAIEEINNKINKIENYNRMINQSNFQVIQNGNGNIKEYSKGIKSGTLIKAWQSGNITEEDIMNWFTEYPECISSKDFHYFARKKFKLTPFDNPQIIEGRYYTATQSKLSINSNYYKSKESYIIKKELQKLNNVDSNKKIIIIDGLPGAGKSSIIEHLLKQTKERFYVSDSDNIKQEFTEYYKNGIGAALVHKAASHLYKNKLIPEVMSQGKNLIYQTCGSYESLNKLLKDASELGYTVNYININTDIATCIKRAANRLIDNGRFIDPCTIIEVSKKNTNAKKFMAEIMSYNPYINKTYKCLNYELQEVKNGEIKNCYNLDKPTWHFKLKKFLNNIL